MVKVSAGVREGPSRVDAAVRALGIAWGRYPESETRVRFPIDPEGIFSGDPAPAEIVAVDLLEVAA